MTAFEQIPKQVQAAIAGMAYERGHSAGQQEVDMIQESIAFDLLPSLKQLEADSYNKGLADARSEFRTGKES